MKEDPEAVEGTMIGSSKEGNIHKGRLNVTNQLYGGREKKVMMNKEMMILQVVYKDPSADTLPCRVIKKHIHSLGRNKREINMAIKRQNGMIPHRNRRKNNPLWMLKRWWTSL